MALLMVGPSSRLIAQVEGCGTGTLLVVTSKSLQVPAEADLVAVLAKDSSVLAELPTVPASGKWTPGEADIAKLLEAKAKDPVAVIAFEKKAPGGNQVLCRRPEWRAEGLAGPADLGAAPVVAGGPAEGGLGEKVFKQSECRAAGAAWETELRRQAPAGRFTGIVFFDGGAGDNATPCYYSRDYGVVGDPIYVAVLTENPLNWTEISFDPCAAESAAPNVLQASETFPTGLTAAQQTAGEYHLATFLPRRCYNTSVDITIKAPTLPRTKRYPLKQSDRYRATLQAGVLFTKQHDQDFGLRPSAVGSADQVIFNQGPADRGPEYTASLVLYAFPRYIASLFGAGEGSYPGRDVLHEQSVLDRLGLVLGVGLKNPGERFVLGFSGELLYGVNAVGVWEFARVRQLNGFAVGDPFAGAPDAIPTNEVWNTDFVFGLSVDIRYVSLLFTGSR
ncbi:MAG: hypothetical protein ACREOC_03345 [Gemmatimonadales bacterium]